MRVVRPALLALPLLLPPALDAQTAARSRRPSAAVTARLDSLARAALAAEPMAGASVAVLRGRDTLLLAGYGMADLGLGVPVTPATTFRLIGVGTTMLAAGLLQQVEAGRLRLDDDASRLLPDFPWQGRHVTVRQLMDATSGLPDYHYLGDRLAANRAVPKAHDEVTALFAELPFAHEPGAKWQWTISGFHLATGLLERLTGKSYGEYLRERVIAPAGLTRTFYCDDRTVTPGLARSYEALSGEFRNAPLETASLYGPAAGFCGTATDVAAFARALRDGRLLTPASWRALTTAEGVAAARPVPTDSFYAHGVGIRMSREEGHRWVGESGSLMGYSAALMDFPDDSLTVAVLANTGSATATRLSRQLARVALGFEARPPARTRGPQPAVASRVTLSPAERARYVGTYVLRQPNAGGPFARAERTYRVFDENGRLTVQALGETPTPLLAQGDHVFLIATNPLVRFVFAVEGDRATELTIRSSAAGAGGGPPTGRRVGDGTAAWRAVRP